MSQSYVGEIRMFAGNFAPVGWHFCDGSLIPISENDTLYNLIGTTYGGDGQSTFALPDLRGRVPRHQGSGFTPGQLAGVESVTLTTNTIPAHRHSLLASTDTASSTVPTSNVLATTGTTSIYASGATPNRPMAAQSVSSAGGSQPHDNMQPLLTVSFIISLFGIYPTPS